MSHDAQQSTESPRARKAGAFDIRVFIASLIGLYGVVVLLMGLFGTTDADIQRAGGLNINLLAGAGMVLAAIGFVVWARLRPVVVAPPKNE